MKIGGGKYWYLIKEHGVTSASLLFQSVVHKSVIRRDPVHMCLSLPAQTPSVHVAPNVLIQELLNNILPLF